MIERLGELNDKFFQLYGELHYNEELLTNEQSRFMANCLFQQYTAEYERLQLSCGIEENKEYMRLKMLYGAYTPRRRFFRKNRALKQLLREVSEEVNNYFRECDRRLQEYINAQDEEEDESEEIQEEEQKVTPEEDGAEERADVQEEVGEEEPAAVTQEEQGEQQAQEPAADEPTGEQEQPQEETASEEEEQQEEQAAAREENREEEQPQEPQETAGAGLINEIVVERESDGQEQTDGKKPVKKRGKKKQTKKQLSGQISFIS